MTQRDNEQLLRSLSAGDMSAMRSLYDLFVGKLYRYVVCLTHDRCDAEDIVQNVFLKIWDNRKIVAQVDSLDRYIFRIAKNAVMDYFDHKVIKAKFAASFDKKNIYADIVDEHIDTDDLELLIAIEIEKLPEQRKKIFKMSRFEGYSNRDIADILGLSVNTIERHIGLAIRDLRKAVIVNIG